MKTTLAGVALIAAAQLGASPVDAATIYTAGNGQHGNILFAFAQNTDGTLAPAGSVATGGNGNGGFLGNQGGIALGGDGDTALVVNAQSNSVAAVRLSGALTLTGLVDSGGSVPNSIAARGRRVYVLNTASNTVTGFTLRADGSLASLPGAVASLGATNIGGAQVSFSADGRALIVTGRGANTLVALPVRQDGTLGARVVSPSAGNGPFGFAVAPDGTVVVSEVEGGVGGGGTVSSYRLGADLRLSPVSAAVPTLQSATCWLTLSPDGRWAYASNTASHSITQFALGADGGLTRVPRDGRSATVGTGLRALDAVVDAAGRNLYTVDFGTPSVSSFAIAADGTLGPARTLAFGLHGRPNGIIAR